MAFVALQRLKLTGRDGAQNVIMPGQEVPGWSEVSNSARWSLLRSHHVVDTDSGKLHPSVLDGRIAMQKFAWPAAAEATLACGKCDKTFATKGRLRNHVKAKH